MKRLFRSIIVKLQYVYIALRNINKPHLGDFVMYKGVECSLIQGVNNPYWDLLPMTDENLKKSKRDIYRHVHKKDFKLEPFWKRFALSFLYTYNFYMVNWYDIDIRNSGRIAYISN